MSARNWRQCPQCIKVAAEERVKAIAEAQKCYGKVPADDYRKMIEAAEKETEEEETMREDYEIGVSTDGRFYVYYGCSCGNCGFSFSFEHKADAFAKRKK